MEPVPGVPPGGRRALAALRRGGRGRRLAGAGAHVGARQRHGARRRARPRARDRAGRRLHDREKVKVAEPGQSPAEDEARVEAVRDALGPSGRIRVDANGGWDVDAAVAAIGRLDRAAGGLEYVEQPCASVEDLAAVRRAVGVPIAADESIRRAADPYRVRDLEAADVAVLKVQPLGGVRACLRIAEDIGLPVVVSSALETSVGIAAGVALAAALPEPALRLRAGHRPAAHRRRRGDPAAAGRRRGCRSAYPHRRRRPRAARGGSRPRRALGGPAGRGARVAAGRAAGCPLVTTPSTALAREVVTARSRPASPRS